MGGPTTSDKTLQAKKNSDTQQRQRLLMTWKVEWAGQLFLEYCHRVKARDELGKRRTI